MSSDASTALLTALLDGLTLVQGQIDKVARAQDRIELAHEDIMARLDTIDVGQAGVTELVPILETILARSIEDRDLNRHGFERTAEVAAFAYSAAIGNPAPLPDDTADDPLLERYTIAQPADHASTERALAEWRNTAAATGIEDLIALLICQYQPSPTDTVETRVLRYRLAAVTRSEIEGRGVTPPALPASTVARDRSVNAGELRSTELARLWRAGESVALFAEPELAGALDLFAEAERRVGRVNEERMSVELATLHGDIGDRLERGDRPSIADARSLQGSERAYSPTDSARRDR